MLASQAVAQPALVAPVDPPGEPAQAEPSSPPEVAFDLSAGTHFPVSLGLDAHLEVPYRILASVHVGWMPPAYVEVINAVCTSAGWYNQQTAALVSAALEGAFVLRLSAGWRPFEHEGFEFLLGYTLIAAAGSVTSAEAIQAGTGRTMNRPGASVSMHATLHALHAVVGWRFVIEEHLAIAVHLGWVHTVYSDTVIDLPAGPGNAVGQAEDYLDNEIFMKWAFSPELRVMMGYRF